MPRPGWPLPAMRRADQIRGPAPRVGRPSLLGGVLVGRLSEAVPLAARPHHPARRALGIGPRAARLHVSAGGRGISTGAGPLPVYRMGYGAGAAAGPAECWASAPLATAGGAFCARAPRHLDWEDFPSTVARPAEPFRARHHGAAATRGQRVQRHERRHDISGSAEFIAVYQTQPDTHTCLATRVSDNHQVLLRGVPGTIPNSARCACRVDRGMGGGHP
jgi:hypothetical protein